MEFQLKTCELIVEEFLSNGFKLNATKGENVCSCIILNNLL